MNKLLKRYLNYRHSSNSYSQYPTDYKKYEFRTGTIEGLFVSSVDFCITKGFVKSIILDKYHLLANKGSRKFKKNELIAKQLANFLQGVLILKNCVSKMV